MDKPYLPTNDLLFGKLFGRKSNLEIIQGFLHDFFNLVVPTTAIHIVNPYSIDNYDKPHITAGKGLQETRRDITMTIINLGDITIEMQIANRRGFIQRAVFYNIDLFHSNYAQNNDHNKFQSLKKVWSMNILNFVLFQDDDRALRAYSLRDNHDSLLLEPELIRIGFFELPKHPSDPILAAWRLFFTTGKAPTGAPQYLTEAAKLIAYHNLTPTPRNAPCSTTSNATKPTTKPSSKPA